MTSEDRLRRLLQEHDDVPLSGDGLARIRERLGARRSLRTRLLVPAAALLGVAGVAAAAVLAVAATDHGTLKPKPAPRATAVPSPTASACSGGLCIEQPKPQPSAAPSDVTTSAGGVPVWPFTTDAQADEWRRAPGRRAWASEPVQVVQHLLDDFLKLPGTAVGTARTRADAVSVVVKVGNRAVSTVQVERVGTVDGPWSVTGAASEDVGVTAPASGTAIESPLTVTGRVTGYDQSVHVRLLTGSGGTLADAHAMAGADQPWSQPLRWSDDAWSVGAVVASLLDGKGDLHAIALTAVRRQAADSAGLPAAGTAFVAVEQGHVVLVDAVTGATLRQLSYPPQDATDSDPVRGSTDGVVWVRTRGDGCTSSLLRAALAHGATGITVESSPRRRRLPALSDGGRSLGWVESACQDGAPETVVVRGPDGRLATVADAPGHVTSLDVRDNGTALVGFADRAVILPTGATTFASARPLRPTTGCTVSAPGYDGVVATAWERCGQSARLMRYTADGAPAKVGGTVAATPAVVRMTVASGFALLVLDDGSVARFTGGRITLVPDGNRLTQAAW